MFFYSKIKRKVVKIMNVFMSNPEKVLARVFERKSGEIEFVVLKFLEGYHEINIAFDVKDKNEVLEKIKEAIENPLVFETD